MKERDERMCLNFITVYLNHKQMTMPIECLSQNFPSIKTKLLVFSIIIVLYMDMYENSEEQKSFSDSYNLYAINI